MYIPTETQYADDVTFINTSGEYLQEALPIIKTRILEWHLLVNASTTEWVELALSNQIEQKGVEAWQNTKALGSLLGDQQDVHRRKQQAAIAFHKMMVIWFQRQKVSKSRRIGLHKTQRSINQKLQCDPLPQALVHQPANKQSTSPV